MDGARFDRVAKTVASSVSRRSLLKTLAGAATAALIGTANATGARAATKRAPGELCRKDGECASGFCGARDATGRQRCLCQSANDCGPGKACTSGTCTIVCPAGSKPCGNDCISLTSCCTAGDCNGTTCQNGLCVCGSTTCGAGQVCDTSGVCSNGCFIKDQFNPSGKFWWRGEYNSDGDKPCRICQPEENLNWWVNAPAGNPCANDCRYACDGAGACDYSKRATTIQDPYGGDPLREECTVNCVLMDGSGPCCSNCWYEENLAGNCFGSDFCGGPIGRFKA